MAEIEGGDRDPRRAVEGLEWEDGGHHLAQHLEGHRPVSEEQVAPTLRHDPWLAWQRPWSMAALASRVFRPPMHRSELRGEGCGLTRRLGPETVRVAARELLKIRLGDFAEAHAQAGGGGGEAPEHVAELLGHALDAGLAALKNALAHETQYLARLLGQPRGRVEQTFVRSERRIHGADGGLLILV